VRAQASGAGVLVPLPEISCALPHWALKLGDAGAPPVASWNARELPVMFVAEALGLSGAIGPHSIVLVHERGPAALGLVVDSVGAVLWISTQQRLPVPETARVTVASAVVQTDSGLFWLLEPEQFWRSASEATA
jgi:chemotaxis signal transduction protein